MYIISFSDLNFHGRILKCTWLRWTRFYIWTQSAIFIPISNFFVNLFSKLPNEMRHLFASQYTSLMASFDIEKCTVPQPLLQPLWCMLVDSTILERIIYYLPIYNIFKKLIAIITAHRWIYFGYIATQLIYYLPTTPFEISYC